MSPRRSNRIRLRQLREAAAQAARIASGASPVANASRPRGRPRVRRSQASPAAVVPSSRLAPGNLQADSTVASATQPTTPTPVAGTSAASSSLVPFSQLESQPEPQPKTDLRGVVGRLTRELHDFMREPPEGCQVKLVNDNVFKWSAKVPGPTETPYEGGIFQLSLNFSHDYPFKPPNVYFLTRIYHCNIASTGHICLDILDTQWSPALTVSKVLLSIISLLSDPNPDDPLEPGIAEVYKRSVSEYTENARSWTNQYAKPESDQEDSP